MPDRGEARPRFEDLTETTGVSLSPEGADMMYTRYSLAAESAIGRRVLEIGCGAAQGFGLMGRSAASLVGSDVSLPMLRGARRHYGARFPFVRASAEALPFRTGAFDLLICFEASYYVPDITAGLQEIARVLTAGGMALLVNANPERPDFIRSPHSVRYQTADEFRRALEALGFSVTVEGAFRVGASTHGRLRALGLTHSLLRRALETLGLVPTTLRGRAWLKRLVYGKLREVPAELPQGFASVARPIGLAPGPVREFKVLYVSATKAGRSGRKERVEWAS
jgi:SAM-dependent methyltransferase